MPGFTCGSDPTLRIGAKIVVRDVPDTGYNSDDRKVKLLKNEDYEDLKSDLATQTDCPNHGNQCETIGRFSDGCASSDNVDGFVIFNNPFNQADCEPSITYTGSVENGTYIEERQLYLGYDDLVHSVDGLGTKIGSHKVYEISCKINKIGEVDVEVEVEQVNSHHDNEDHIDTNFFVNKYFGNGSTRRRLNDNEVIPFSPNSNSNDRFQFKIWSDHPDEYVHLETCSLSFVDPRTGQSLTKEFINDGCVKDDFQFLFSNEDRISATNEDWFNMRTMVAIGSCKSTWRIDCTVVSCNRDLDHCKPGDECAERYTAAFMRTNARKRRYARNASSPAEIHVVSNLVHPCFYVHEHNPLYCADLPVHTCWSLQQCAAAFPNDFPQVPIDDDSDVVSGLHQIMEEFEAAIQQHIEQRMSENKFAHEHIMASIRDNANRVLDNQQTFDEAIEEIIRLINA